MRPLVRIRSSDNDEVGVTPRVQSGLDMIDCLLPRQNATRQEAGTVGRTRLILDMNPSDTGSLELPNSATHRANITEPGLPVTDHR